MKVEEKGKRTREEGTREGNGKSEEDKRPAVRRLWKGKMRPVWHLAHCLAHSRHS
jgi:hypothetical protein